VNDRFLRARADGGPGPIAREPVYLAELVADTVRVLRVLAGQRGVRIELAPLPEALVQGDPRQAKPLDHEQTERRRKEQKEPVAGYPPEAQEEQSRDGIACGERAGDE
jgi:hypothetical protein